jgi:hypothetical protein
MTRCCWRLRGGSGAASQATISTIGCIVLVESFGGAVLVAGAFLAVAVLAVREKSLGFGPNLSGGTELPLRNGVRDPGRCGNRVNIKF